MRIKRFIAPDMRSALRMIRDEQGPDAVILSNRTVEGGIEVVAATDYDEALVAQALRAAAPGLDTISAPIDATAVAVERAAARMPMRTSAAAPAPHHAQPQASAATNAHVAAAPARGVPVARAEAAATPMASDETSMPARESLISRARAVFKIGDGRAIEGPTLAELSAAPANAQVRPASAISNIPAAQAASAVVAQAPAITADTAMAPSRFEAMMAALDPAAAATADNVSAGAMPTATTASTAVARDALPITAGADDSTRADAAPTMPSARVAITVADSDETPTAVATIATQSATPSPILRAVASDEQAADPTIVAMREELARMRQLIETQMDQLTLERLRGSPARNAVIDTLVGCGCEESLAQAVAGGGGARRPPRLPPDEIQKPMFAELARMLTIARCEPIDDGGVIALVGPTGSGKTTTAARLAARFAARHRARDVALVTTDTERAGAREQLHAHGRRLGITVCEAAGPEGLQDALAQLVDYPLVLVDTTGHAPRDRALFGQILWLRAARKVRSLLVLPANAHPHDLGETIRRYRPAAPEGVVLTKLDETGRLGSALSVAVRHGLNLAYVSHGQQVPSDIDCADAAQLVHTLEKSRRAADNPLAVEDRHAVA